MLAVMLTMPPTSLSKGQGAYCMAPVPIAFEYWFTCHCQKRRRMLHDALYPLTLSLTLTLMAAEHCKWTYCWTSLGLRTLKWHKPCCGSAQLSAVAQEDLMIVIKCSKLLCNCLNFAGFEGCQHDLRQYHAAAECEPATGNGFSDSFQTAVRQVDTLVCSNISLMSDCL